MLVPTVCLMNDLRAPWQFDIPLLRRRRRALTNTASFSSSFRVSYRLMTSSQHVFKGISCSAIWLKKKKYYVLTPSPHLKFWKLKIKEKRNSTFNVMIFLVFIVCHGSRQALYPSRLRSLTQKTCARGVAYPVCCTP